MWLILQEFFDLWVKASAARQRFYLPEGFTCKQLQERYADILDKAPSDQFNRVNADYEILLACCD